MFCLSLEEVVPVGLGPCRSLLSTDLNFDPADPAQEDFAEPPGKGRLIVEAEVSREGVGSEVPGMMKFVLETWSGREGIEYLLK